MFRMQKMVKYEIKSHQIIRDKEVAVYRVIVVAGVGSGTVTGLQAAVADKAAVARECVTKLVVFSDKD